MTGDPTLSNILSLLQEQPSKTDFQLLALAVNILAQKLETRLPNLEANMDDKFSLINEKIEKIHSKFASLDVKLDSLLSSPSFSSYLPKLAFPEVAVSENHSNIPINNPEKEFESSIPINDNGKKFDNESLDFGASSNHQQSYSIQVIDDCLSFSVPPIETSKLNLCFGTFTSFSNLNSNSGITSNYISSTQEHISSTDSSSATLLSRKNDLQLEDQPPAKKQKHLHINDSKKNQKIKSDFKVANEINNDFIVSKKEQPKQIKNDLVVARKDDQEKKCIKNDLIFARKTIQYKSGVEKLDAICLLFDSVNSAEDLTLQAKKYYFNIMPIVHCFRNHYNGDGEGFIGKWGNDFDKSNLVFARNCCSRLSSCIMRGNLKVKNKEINNKK